MSTVVVRMQSLSVSLNMSNCDCMNVSLSPGIVPKLRDTLCRPRYCQYSIIHSGFARYRQKSIYNQVKTKWHARHPVFFNRGFNVIWYGNGLVSLVVIGGICSLFPFAIATIFSAVFCNDVSMARITFLCSAVARRSLALPCTAEEIPAALPNRLHAHTHSGYGGPLTTHLPASSPRRA